MLRSSRRNIDLPELYVDTVDAFEGEEADVVILSLVRSNEAERIGFLKKAQRLNVAISRAKHLLIVVGDIETLTGREGQDLYRPLLEHIEREGRVAGIGALHAMDAAVGGRQRDRRRGRLGQPAAGRRGRRRRPYVAGGTAAAVSPNGAEKAAEGTPPGPAVEGAAGQQAAPRRFRRRRGRRRGPGHPPPNGEVGQAPAGEQAPAPPQPAPMAQAD